jgi:hypothetical protein
MRPRASAADRRAPAGKAARRRRYRRGGGGGGEPECVATVAMGGGRRTWRAYRRQCTCTLCGAKQGAAVDAEDAGGQYPHGPTPPRNGIFRV